MRNALLVIVYVFLLILAVPILLVCVLFGLRETFLAYGHWMMRVSPFESGMSTWLLVTLFSDPRFPAVRPSEDA